MIWNISPVPDTTIEDTLVNVEFYLFDGISGLDTLAVQLTVSGTPVDAGVMWTGSYWNIVWSAASPFHRGDTIHICVWASDTTGYCDDNVLDTCWSIYIRPCVDNFPIKKGRLVNYRPLFSAK
ncbi:hypothetical protein J7M00_05815 [bacterium]|nr:hypothetical protein [bacterium]